VADAVTTLAKISQARRALAAASTLHDVMQIRDQAEALRVYVKAAGEGLEAQNAAAEFKLRAERKAGAMLADMEKNAGAATPATRSQRVTALPPSLHDLGIDKMQSSRWQSEADVSEEKFEAYIASCRDEGREVTQSGLLKIANGSHVSLNSGENEWYTPPEILDAARSAMGSIDIDPASRDTAQANVRAKRYYAIEDDGLSKKWRGNVWLNPPYGKDVIGLFASKVVAERQRYNQAVVLVNNATETAWFNEIASVASAICFLRGRVKFLGRDGKPANTPIQGQAVLYIGSDVGRFCEAFADMGLIVMVCRQEANDDKKPTPVRHTDEHDAA
jgi:phage N-6-adenine-methyltransferase